MYKLVAFMVCLFAILTFSGYAAPPSDSDDDKRAAANVLTNSGRRPKVAKFMELSINAITIELHHAKPNYRLPDIDRNFDAKELAEFLTKFYDSIPANNLKPDIILGSSPKMLFDPTVITAVRKISQQHSVSVVRMPPMTGRDPHAPLRDFADATLNPRNITK